MPTAARHDWRVVDEGWGRRAVDFATLSEPANCREYVSMHQRLGVDRGDRLLDVACGAGLAVELARLRGATCAGIDASPRLIEVARDRNPGADLRVGDMQALPWDDATFDVVTSFRGIWGTTPDAVAEAFRVLVPGGRIGVTVWGHLKRSPGVWALTPIALASKPKIERQAAMVALGRPGVGEQLLVDAGFEGVERGDIPFAWEFTDSELYARALAATGPAYEAIQDVGEDAFVQHARELAEQRLRDGLPLRAEIAVVGFTARKPAAAPAPRDDVATSGSGFLAEPATTPDVQRLYDDDLAELGYVMNVSRLWAQRPDLNVELFEVLGHATKAGQPTFRQRGILVSACASTLGDGYCALAWGKRLAGEAGDDVAAGVLRGDDELLDDSDRALARWARRVTRAPNSTAAADVQALRDAGFVDEQIFAITVYIALRIAFSTVNDALGARPDRRLADSAPAPVRAAVTFGRPISADG
jgi:SAM-dependent methyltransferase/alkylhydroperoxidase family enzyme